MLHHAQAVARRYSGNSTQWHHPYGEPEPHAAVSRASVWFTAYPASTIADPAGASVLATLSDERLWRALQQIGIQGMHTGPVKLSGGLRGRSYTPSVDGHFDRISFEIDPAFGTASQYKALVATAHRHGAIVIGDIVPGHTGKGADWLLAERAFKDYPGLYSMVSIPKSDWGLLPSVPPGQDAVNLSPATVDALAAKGYIVGQLHSGIFYADCERGLPLPMAADFACNILAEELLPSVDEPVGVRGEFGHMGSSRCKSPTFFWKLVRHD